MKAFKQFLNESIVNESSQIVGHDIDGNKIFANADLSKYQLVDITHNVPESKRDQMKSRKKWTDAVGAMGDYEKSVRGTLSKMNAAQKRAHLAKEKELKDAYEKSILDYKTEALKYLIDNPITEETPNTKALEHFKKILKEADEKKSYSVMTAYQDAIKDLNRIVSVEKNEGIVLPLYQHHLTRNGYKALLKKAKIDDRIINKF